MSVRPIEERPPAEELPSAGTGIGAAWRAIAGPLGRYRLMPVLVLAVLMAAAPLLFPSAYYYRVAALVYVFALAAVGLNLLMGFAGQVSLGHAGFMGIGAYAVAIGPAHFGLPGWLALLAGGVLSAIIAFIVGRPILRLKGHYLAVATLGFGLLLAILFTNEAAWTGGPDGMAVRRLVLFEWAVRGSQTWYWVSGALFLLGAALAYNLIDSPAGRAMRAIHDSETAASVLGIDVARTKLVIFVISAVYASVAGSSLAFFNGHITPDVAGFLRSIELVAMVVLGGMGSIIGSLIGAAVLVMLPQVLTFLHDYEHMVLGLVIMGVMIFLRNGIVPSIAAALRGRQS
jgi:branched-chain amino acid transport system permease protein